MKLTRIITQNVLAVLLGFSFLFAQTAYAAQYPITGQNFFLAGAGVTSSQTTVPLTSLKTPGGIPITMSMIGSLGYGVLEPQSASKVELITFTGVTQNAIGSAVLTGVTRGIDFAYPYPASTTLRQAHSGGATFIISATPNWYFNEFGMTGNDSVVTGSWTFPTPTANSNPATKQYVDSLVSGGTVTNVSVTVPATAGETVVAGQILYLKPSDSRWYKATVTDGNASTTMLGIAEGAGTAGGAIANGGVLVRGLDTNQSGLAAGTSYYVGATAGTVSSAKSGRIGGVARNATTIYIDPSYSPVPQWAGLPFTTQSTQGASSTALLNDGAGNLSWNPVSSGLAASSSPISFSLSSASTTIYQAAIPAGSMKDGNALQVRIHDFEWAGALPNNPMYIEAGYGNATTSLNVMAVPNGSTLAPALKGDLVFTMKSTGATAQRNFLDLNLASTTLLTGSQIFGGTTGQLVSNTFRALATSTTATDSTANQILTIIVRMNTTGITFASLFGTTELIRQ